MHLVCMESTMENTTNMTKEKNKDLRNIKFLIISLLILNSWTYFKFSVKIHMKEKGILEVKQLHNHKRI